MYYSRSKQNPLCIGAAPFSSLSLSLSLYNIFLCLKFINSIKMNEPPKYAYPYAPQGYYQGPPVMAPPQYGAAPPPPLYSAAPPPKKEHGFLKGCLAALCCCCLLDECCCDPSIVLVG